MNKVIELSLITIFFALFTTSNSFVLADRDDDDDDEDDEDDDDNDNNRDRDRDSNDDDDDNRDSDRDEKSSNKELNKKLCKYGLPLAGYLLGDPTGFLGGLAASALC